MSFIDEKKFKSHKLTKKFDPEKYEEVDSFNYLAFEKDLLSEDTKIVIVGTLTPPDGRSKGFFYSSKENEQFDIIDNATKKKYIDGLSLVIKKEALGKSSNDSRIIDEICEILKKRNIGLLDVVKKAVASKTSSRDDDIIDYVLDIESFKNLMDLNPNVTLIANSFNALIALTWILKNIGCWIGANIVYIPQLLRGKKIKCKTKNDMIRELAKHI